MARLSGKSLGSGYGVAGEAHNHLTVGDGRHWKFPPTARPALKGGSVDFICCKGHMTELKFTPDEREQIHDTPTQDIIHIQGVENIHMRFRSIQVLRAAAALSVLLYHYSVLSIGYAGVDVFFIISGFIMGTIGVRERPVDFIVKRLIRVVPVYWTITITMCALSLVPSLFARFTFTYCQLIKSLLFIPYFNQDGKIWPLLIPGWTLNYEMFFYTIFFFGLIARKPIIFTSFLMLSFIISGVALSPPDPMLRTWSNLLLLEFIAGLLLSQVVFVSGVRLGIGLIAFGIGAYAAGAVFADEESNLRVLVLGTPALALVAGAVAIERAGRWPNIKFAETVGDASYSLYLLHGIIIAFTRKFLNTTPAVEFLVVVAICVLLSYVSLQIFERPVAKLLRNAVLN